MSNQLRGGLTGAASGAATGAMVGGPVGAVVGGILGGVSGILGGGAADDAEKIARMNAQLIEMQTDENVRRQKLQMEMEVGQAVAQIAQSDLLFTGSSKRYTDELKSQWLQDVAQTQRQGFFQQRIARKGGQAAASGIMNNMYASQLSMLGSAAVSTYNPAGGTAGQSLDLAIPQYSAQRSTAPNLSRAARGELPGFVPSSVPGSGS